MKKQDEVRFAEIMIGLAENFSAQMSTPGLVMRFEAMKEFSIDEIASAATKLVKTRTMMGMPTVAEFIVAMGLQAPAVTDAANEQATAVMKQIRDLGSYRTPVFDDPITKSLMASRWSWAAVCSMTEAELKWWTKDFVEAYQANTRTDTQHRIECDNTPRLKLLAGGIGKRG
jgi:hypothetical protein